MANARDIADERLARGEITADEHGRIISSISESKRRDEISQGHESAAKPLGKILLSIGGLTFLALTVMMFQLSSSGEGMSVLGRAVWFLAFCVAGVGAYLVSKK